MKQFKHNTTGASHTFTVSPDKDQERIDIFLSQQLPAYSRSYFQKCISNGLVTVNGASVAKPGYRVKAGDQVTCTLMSIDFQATAAHVHEEVAGLAVTLIAQEPDFFIINKPAGLVVHKPSHSSTVITLVDWLLAQYPGLKNVGADERPGIVHRLDKDTSGLMIIPRTAQAHATFTQLFKDRLVTKTYNALVQGHPPKTMTIDYRIMRHPTERTKMAHSKSQGRHAVTDIQTQEYFKDSAFIVALPHTGRTHQIRVHCASAGFPILGDTVYGKKSPLIARQALHAAQLDFEYGSKDYHFVAPLPEDFQHALTVLHSQINER